eukprot:CAMPEP_0119070942 /NCGR_PEP_ID=MMETSP1178-20130426/45870_1 /TAXON_ID=33656 /ORGANISM="unid sp, Strain CCMP2000" /LENGTH=275 /DNA_ID=CAMNT_0007052823 /DNA_START=57 /DNA_END=885 /DNA_ORIENTATION=-
MAAKPSGERWGVRPTEVVGGAPSSDGLPFGAWGAHAASSESEDLANMQQRTEHHKQQVKDAERRILHKVEETRQIGASTLAKLHLQHEQLDRVATAQDEVATNLATSERLLRGMESWRGAFVNTVTGWFSDDSAQLPATGRNERAGVASGDGACKAPAATGAPQQSAAAELDSVGQISQVVSDLRTQAELINSELREQSGLLDGLSDLADRNAAGLQRNAQRTKSLVDAKVWTRVDRVAEYSSTYVEGRLGVRAAGRSGVNPGKGKETKEIDGEL